MFYDQITKICNEKGVKLTPLLKELGLSTGNTGRWKKGGVPSIEVVSSLAMRLDVSVDYLLGNTDDPNSHKKKSPELIDSREKLQEALIAEGILSEDKPLTEEEKNAILSFAEIFFKRNEK